MIDASSKTARLIASTAVMIAAGCTTVMNVKFAYNMGSDETEKILFAAFGGSLDAAKFLGLAFAANAWRKNYKTKAMLATLVWTVAVCYSLVAAFGFSATVRSSTTAERMNANKQAELATSAYVRLVNEFDVMKSNVRYTSTAGCSVPVEKMAKESVGFCNSFWAKNVEVNEAKKSVPNHVIKDTDPQMTLFSQMFGVSKEVLVLWWSIAFAFMAEIIASFGSYAFSSSRAAYGSSSEKVTRKTAPNVPVADTNGQPVVKRKPGRPVGSKKRTEDEVIDWCRAFEAKHGREPKIPEVQQRFPAIPKTTAWRRVRAAAA